MTTTCDRVTIKGAAAAWGVHTNTARKYIRRYKVRCHVFSRRMIQIDPSEVDRVLRLAEARWTWMDRQTELDVLGDIEKAPSVRHSIGCPKLAETIQGQLLPQ
jgi:hypothetical protein